MDEGGYGYFFVLSGVRGNYKSVDFLTLFSSIVKTQNPIRTEEWPCLMGSLTAYSMSRHVGSVM